MIETHVKATIDAVSNYIPQEEEAEFWHWLGNDKFPEDEANLTKERAYKIRRHVKELYQEFLICYGKKV